MTDEIVQIIRGTYATEDSIRTQAEEALARLDKGIICVVLLGCEIQIKLFRLVFWSWVWPRVKRSRSVNRALFYSKIGLISIGAHHLISTRSPRPPMRQKPIYDRIYPRGCPCPLDQSEASSPLPWLILPGGTGPRHGQNWSQVFSKPLTTVIQTQSTVLCEPCESSAPIYQTSMRLLCWVKSCPDWSMWWREATTLFQSLVPSKFWPIWLQCAAV